MGLTITEYLDLMIMIQTVFGAYDGRYVFPAGFVCNETYFSQYKYIE